MSKQELKKHAGSLPCSKGDKLWWEDLPPLKTSSALKTMLS